MLVNGRISSEAWTKICAVEGIFADWSQIEMFKAFEHLNMSPDERRKFIYRKYAPDARIPE